MYFPFVDIKKKLNSQIQDLLRHTMNKNNFFFSGYFKGIVQCNGIIFFLIQTELQFFRWILLAS